MALFMQPRVLHLFTALRDTCVIPNEADPEHPSPLPPRAEVVLLTLMAVGLNRDHELRELLAVTELLAMSQAELARHLLNLRARGLVSFGEATELIQVTPDSIALLLELAEERLTDNILRQRPLEEQAEALVIWRLQHLDHE